MIHAHIKKMLGLTRWGSTGLRASPEETLILTNWEIWSIPAFARNIVEQIGAGSSPEA